MVGELVGVLAGLIGLSGIKPGRQISVGASLASSCLEIATKKRKPCGHATGLS
jgi:hypothetical protein